MNLNYFSKFAFRNICIFYILVSLFACVFDTSDDDTNTAKSTDKLFGNTWIDNHTRDSGQVYIKILLFFVAIVLFYDISIISTPMVLLMFILILANAPRITKILILWNTLLVIPVSKHLNNADGSIKIVAPPASRNYTYKYKIENSKLYIVNSSSYSSTADFSTTEWVYTKK